MLASPLAHLISVVFTAYYVLLIARVIMSWLPSSSLRSPMAVSVGRIVYSFTEPLLAPVRRALRPYMGGTPVDFSPLILYFVLQVLEQLILRVL